MNTPSKTPLDRSTPSDTRISTKSLVAALLLAASIGLGVVTYGTKVGFNNDPRGPHKKGVELSDGKVNRVIMCLRELFHDVVTQPAFKNKWMAKSCDQDAMDELSKPPDQLRKIVEARKTTLRQEGIDPGVETWFSDKGKMKIVIDEVSRKAGINAGKIEE